MKNRVLPVWLCVFGVLLPLPRIAVAQVREESAVRAAFVFNLTKYVEWPQPSDSLLIGVVGDGPMSTTLKSMLDGKASESRTIHVLLSPSDEALERCNIVYIAGRPSQKTRLVLDRVHTKNILTVGETDSFARDGGMVGLVRVGEQVQLQVNLQVTQKSHLKISSRLLNIAVLVTPAAGAKN